MVVLLLLLFLKMLLPVSEAFVNLSSLLSDIPMKNNTYHLVKGQAEDSFVLYA